MVISIIVPIYNTEKCLCKCLNSIVNQTFKDLEIILVNDGSKDKSGEICAEYARKDKRIKVIYQENLGLSSARNNGLDTATGDYITFVDSDDYIELDTYADVAEAIELYDADLTFFREKSVNELGETVYINGGPPSGEIKVGTQEDAAELIIGRQINGMCDKVYKASLLKDLRFVEGKMYGEDIMYNLKALRKVKSIGYIDRIKYSYVMNESSVTHKSFNKNSFDQVFFKDEVAKYINRHFSKYADIGRKRAFLARLRIMRPLYGEEIEGQYKDEIGALDNQMAEMYHSIMQQLSHREKIEYQLYKNSKPLYRIFLKIVEKHRK